MLKVDVFRQGLQRAATEPIGYYLTADLGVQRLAQPLPVDALGGEPARCPVSVHGIQPRIHQLW